MDEAFARPPGPWYAPAWMRADRQSSGRGRRGRDWTSPAGNLNATACFAIDRPTDTLPQLCFVAGIAMCDAIMAVDPVADIRLKWPNDILLGKGKLAGLLVETRLSRGETTVAIGFGANLVPVQREDRAVSFLGGATPTALLAKLDGALIDCLRTWYGEGFEPVRRAWEARGPSVGSVVRPSSLPGVEGRYLGLAPDGGLMMNTRGGPVTVSSGELQ